MIKLQLSQIPEAIGSVPLTLEEREAKLVAAQAELDQLMSTHEGRLKLAASMVQPIRCGGTEYIDGVRHLRLGGWLVPHTVIDGEGDPWPRIRAYQATHEPYVIKHHRGRATPRGITS